MTATNCGSPRGAPFVRRLVANIAAATPWDAIIPATFFAASAISWRDPSTAPAIFFVLLALSTIFVSPIMAYFTKPATEGFTANLTNALNTVTDEKNSEQRDRLFFAVADLITLSVQSAALKKTMKEIVLSSLMDEDLHRAAMDTLHTSVKRAFTGALNDETFVRDLNAGIVGAMVQASKESELTQSILDVVTKAVSQALADERFVAELRGAVKDTLMDGDLYKASAKGMVSAAFGRSGQKSSQQQRK